MFSASFLLDKINKHIAGKRFGREPKGLYEPVDYVLSLGGKRIRPVLMMMACNLYREDVDAILDQALGIEVYHNYTLLHDDLMDRADLRRGHPTVHKVWNDNTAILSGDAMLVLAYQLMASCPADCLSGVLELFSRTALEICEGQQMDMDFESRKDVTEAEYLEMIRLKTSVLLASALKIGAVLGGASEEDAALLYDFGMNLGVAFQLKDDLLDVYGDTALFGKNIGGDILCDKKTYLLIQAYGCADAAQRAALDEWIGVPVEDPAGKVAAVTRLYDEIGVRELCEKQVLEYSRRAARSLAALSVPSERKAELERLMETLIHRES